jgi:hypothetical protein
MVAAVSDRKSDWLPTLTAVTNPGVSARNADASMVRGSIFPTT